MHYPDYNDPRLTKDGEGYIYWKGLHVEHYSHDSVDAELESARELIRRCEHLESLSVPVSCNTAIWRWGWYADLTPDQFGGLTPRSSFSTGS